MAKINRFTRRELSEEEVYTFPVILCDNEVDRDNEKFSVAALKKLAELFIGKTGIWSHDPKGENQTARIYDAEVVTDETKKTADGESYTYLKGEAYMVKTASNADLIKEIDGGIKKEVSVGCSVSREICSVCGKDHRRGDCAHKKGRYYGGKKCFTVLDGPTDAFEWSFVAVPAQRGAGITKRFSGDEGFEKQSDFGETLGEICQDLKRDIIRLSFLDGDSAPAELLKAAIEKMEPIELLKMKRTLKERVFDGTGELEKAMSLPKDKEAPKNESFRI